MKRNGSHVVKKKRAKKSKATINLDDDEEEASSDGGKRSPKPNSVAYSKPKRPNGGKKDAKEKKSRGDDDLKNAMKAIVKARKEANEVRMMTKNQHAAAEERRLMTEERRVTAGERKVTLEKKKLAMKERSRLLEWKNNLFFIDTSILDEKQKE
ncbi:Alternative oxidase 1a, mitochondrial [Hordeum vulgare]|nr:Alternative oxidase 1a, mitochondrial [Hordeum vulgare]